MNFYQTIKNKNLNHSPLTNSQRTIGSWHKKISLDLSIGSDSVTGFRFGLAQPTVHFPFIVGSRKGDISITMKLSTGSFALLAAAATAPLAQANVCLMMYQMAGTYIGNEQLKSF